MDQISVVNEFSKLLWPVLWHVILVVVPPGFRFPLVEVHSILFGTSHLEEPVGEELEATKENPVKNPVEDTISVLFLSRSNDESNHVPDGKEPGKSSAPGDSSVVNSLEPAVRSLNVGKEPEDLKKPEGQSLSPSDDTPSV